MGLRWPDYRQKGGWQGSSREFSPRESRYQAASLAEVLGGAVPMDDAGHHTLKGVPGDWQLYEVGTSTPA
jgi:hypothetical protein